MRFLAALAILLAALVASAEAVTLTQTGAVLTVEYDEPTVNLDGSPLTDLAGTRVTYTVDGGAPVVGPLIPATAPTGGGHVVTQIHVPVQRGQEVAVSVTATAEDLDGNVSDPSDPVARRIDRNPPGKIK